MLAQCLCVPSPSAGLFASALRKGQALASGRDSVHVVLLPAAQTAPDGRDPNTLTGQVGPVLHVGVPTSSGLRVVTWLGAPWLRPGTEWSPRWGLRAQPGPWPSP